MTYHVEIESSAVKALSRIDLADRRRIASKIQGLAANPRPDGAIKLTGADGWRIRVGNYRVVYVIDDTIRVVTVTRIAHRREGLPGFVMAKFVPISEAKGHLSELVRASDNDEVLLMRHGRPAAVLLSARRYDGLLEEIEDLKDRLSVHERDGLTVDFDKVLAEMGLLGE